MAIKCPQGQQPRTLPDSVVTSYTHVLDTNSHAVPHAVYAVLCTLCCVRYVRRTGPHAVCALQVLADRQFADSSKVCPEAKASVFSLITFGWISGLMRQGYKYAHY